MNNTLIEQRIHDCMAEAEKAIESSNTPFGCVITNENGDVIASAHNTVAQTGNPAAHAEIQAIEQACKKLNTFDLSDYTLFANAESCPMCMACALRAGIKTFYFGAASGASTNPRISVQELAAHAKQEVSITSSILGENCAKQIERGYAALN